MEIEKRLLVNSPFSNKRGLSAVVTTLLIILLAIVLIGVVWVVVRNVVDAGTEEVNLEQFTLDLSIQSAYVDSTVGGDIKVGVRRSAGSGELAGIRFIFFDGASSISVDRIIPLDPTEAKVFAFDAVNDVPGIEAGDEVSVVPLFETGTGQQKAARTTDSREISGEIPEGGEGVGDYGEEETDGEVTGCNSNADCDEEAGQICSEDNICITPGSEVPSSCNDTWDGEAEDEGVECDGDPLPNGCTSACLCDTGFSAPDPLDGNCTLNAPVNIGQINSVWPEDKNAQRFQSASLPKSQSELLPYTSYYVNFSNSPETRCFRIQSATYFSDLDMSEIGLMINILSDPLANISMAQDYHIWEAENCGQ